MVRVSSVKVGVNLARVNVNLGLGPTQPNN